MIARRVAFGLVVGLVTASAFSFAAHAAQGNNGQVESSAEVSNEDPVNLRIEVAGDEDPGRPGAQVSPGPGGDTTITLTGYAEDGNGWRDLRKGALRVLRPDGTTVVDGLEGAMSSDGHGRQRTFTFSFQLTAADPPGGYQAQLAVEDRHARTALTDTTIELRDYLAFVVEQSSLSFGGTPLGPGATSHSAPASISVRNVGNVRLDLRLTGGPLTTQEGDASMGPERIRYSSVPDMTNERPLSAEGALDEAFDLPPGLTKSAFFDVHMPTGDEQYVPAGRYTGAITIGGVVG